MKLRPLLVSVAVLAVLSAVVYFMNRPAPPASSDPRIDQSMLASAAIEKTARVHLTDRGKSVDLIRQSDGTWQVKNYYDLPADVGKLSTFLGSFTDAKLQRAITNPDRVAHLELKDSTVKLDDASGTELWSVTLGKNADAGGRFVRFGTEPKAYLANVNAWLDADPKNWARSELLNLKSEDVAKLEITFADGSPVTVSREKKDSPWTATATPAGKKLDTGKVDSLAEQLATIRFSDTSDPADPSVTAARQHERTLKLTTFGGQTYTIALGRKPEEKKPKPPAPADAAGETKAAAATGAPPSALAKSGASAKTAESAKPAEPEFETIPAGPVYAFVASSDAKAPINALMQKRAFEISDYVFTELPQKPADLFEPVPAPQPSPTGEAPAQTPEATLPSANPEPATATPAN
jgi:hypothetical protein